MKYFFCIALVAFSALLASAQSTVTLLNSGTTNALSSAVGGWTGTTVQSPINTSPSVITPGSSGTVSLSAGYNGNVYGITYQIGNSGGAVTNYSTGQTIVAGGNYFFTIMPGGTGTNCNEPVSLTVRNNTQIAQDYFLYNVVTAVIYSFTDITVQPGAVGTMTLTVDCTDVNNISYGRLGMGLIPTTYATTLAQPGGTQAALANQNSPDVYNPTNNGVNANGTNALPILFTSGTNNATLAQEQGSSAIYDAVTKFAVQNHIDLSTAISELATDTNYLGQLTAIDRAGFSNLLSSVGGLANTNTSQSLSNYNLQTTQVGMSNLLSEIESNTAPTSTNIFSMIPNTATNATAALAAATTALGDYGIQGLIDSLVPSLPSAPTAPDMTISFAGHTYNLDPNVLVPNASSVALTGWSIILTLAFLTSMSHLFWKVIQTQSSQQTGGVPDLDIAGFNVAGLIVFLFVPIAFIAIWTAALAWIFANLGVSVASAMAISTWTSSMGTIGWYLLSSFFPVTLFFSLVISRITITFGAAKIVGIASAASRWIMGK